MWSGDLRCVAQHIEYIQRVIITFADDYGDTYISSTVCQRDSIGNMLAFYCASSRMSQSSSYDFGSETRAIAIELANHNTTR